MESLRSSEANRQACRALQLLIVALNLPAVASVSISLPCFCRNTGKIKDWIDAVYVKKRFYSAEAAASAAMHSPPPSQSHVSSVILLYFMTRHCFCTSLTVSDTMYRPLLIKMLLVTAAQAEHQ